MTSRQAEPSALFAKHLPSRLVVADAEEGGVTQAAVARPFCEGDFDDEARLHPHERLHFLRRDAFAPVARPGRREIRERTPRDRQRLDALEHAGARRRREPAADFARRQQLAAVVRADDERIEIRRVRLVAANDASKWALGRRAS